MRQFRVERETPSYGWARAHGRRSMCWLGLILVAIMAMAQTFQPSSLYAASSTEDAAQQEENDNDEIDTAGNGPPSLCERGRLIARPDVVGTQFSLSPVVIHVLENDGPVPPIGAGGQKPPGNPGKPGPPGDKGPDAEDQTDDEEDYSFEIIAISEPRHGLAELSADGTAITYTVRPPANDDNGDNDIESQMQSRTLAEPLDTYTDMFTYTIRDTCEREATAKVIVVVFREDMPATPALITRSHTPGASVKIPLSLPISATLTFPDAAFGARDDEHNGDGENENGETNGAVDLGVSYFSLSAFIESLRASDPGAGSGLRFAQAAFRLAQFRDEQQIVNPTFDAPLLLEIVLDPALLNDDNGQGDLNPQLFYWHEENQAWQRDGIIRESYDPETHKATFAIYHLTEFALFTGQAVMAEALYIPLVMGNQ